MQARCDGALSRRPNIDKKIAIVSMISSISLEESLFAPANLTRRPHAEPNMDDFSSHLIILKVSKLPILAPKLFNFEKSQVKWSETPQ